jgi:hypothetical protein
MTGQGKGVPKGLPKRTTNERAKATRAASWRRGEARKAARRAEADTLHDLKVAAGGLGSRARRRHPEMVA